MKADSADKSLVQTIIIEELERFLQLSRAKDIREKPKITAETDIFDDLAIDSLELMDLVTVIEKRFDISVHPEEMVSRRKINDVAEYVVKLRSNAVL